MGLFFLIAERRPIHETEASAEWNGEGLPPVGVECIVVPHNNMWGFDCVEEITGRVVAYDCDNFWFKPSYSIARGILSRTDKVDFRPIRSPQEIAREQFSNSVHESLGGSGGIISDCAITAIYDAIAAGKIPGIKLE